MQDQEFNLNASKIYLSFLSSVSMGSLLILLCLPIAWSLKLIVFLLVGIYSYHLLFRECLLRSQRAIKSIRAHPDGTWHLYTAKNCYAGKLLGDSTVTTFATILRFRLSKWKSTSCVIFYDALSKDQYRRLLVLLKIQQKIF